jgi:BirA family biotin operon repressor/biotin-[acetyl-CoA-carboxylase] ligase
METLFIGKNLIFLPEVTSTNSYAMNLLKNVNLPEGTVVQTTNQTQGKGQRGSRWMADPTSNLTVSIVLKPTFLELKNQFYLYLISALACYDTMAEIFDNSQFDIKIKWPNDILVNQKKIAGILIENNILNNQINGCVIGIGINVNQLKFDPGINATSIALSLKNEYPLAKVLNLLCSNVEKHYLAMREQKFNLIQGSYLQHLFGLNTWRQFEVGGSLKSLMVLGVSDRGLLLLRDKNDSILEVDVKEVRWTY